MKKIVKITEQDLARIVKKTIEEQEMEEGLFDGVKDAYQDCWMQGNLCPEDRYRSQRPKACDCSSWWGRRIPCPQRGIGPAVCRKAGWRKRQGA